MWTPLWQKFISLRHAGSLNRYQLHIVIVANAYGVRTGYYGCPGEFGGIESKQFRTCLTYAFSFSLFCPRLRQNASITLSLCLSTVVDEVWQCRTGGNIAIFDKDRDTVETDREQLKFL